MYINYNDYELIYLINDGSEKALKVLFEKYSIYIKKIIYKYCYNNNKDDLYQEGLMILNSCIRLYNPIYLNSFFSYFAISLSRRFMALIKKDQYYQRFILLDDPTIYNNDFATYNFINNPKLFFKEEIEIIIYEEYFIGNASLTFISQKYNLKYINNFNSNEGITASIHLGVLHSKNHNDFMFMVGDEPYLSFETLHNFINGYILVNGNTASASEVVAGALQEQLGYKLIGDQTYGKGTAQTQKQLSDGSVLKYTYARWLLPSDTWIDGKGLTPDYSVSNIDISEITSESLESDMGYDSVGTAIASMQKMLNCLGYTCDRSDGYFSSQTVTALQQFEQANNLTVDGIYSDADRQILEATVLIYANDDANDYQYQKLMELVK